MLNIIHELYGSEISCRISTFWDAGYDWYLGPETGYVAMGSAQTLAEAVGELAEAALRCYPDSNFAKRRVASS